MQKPREGCRDKLGRKSADRRRARSQHHQVLQPNGRLGNSEIARALDTTETTVRKRIAWLIDERLMSIVAVTSSRKPHCRLPAIIGIRGLYRPCAGWLGALRTYPEVRYVGMSAGRYDVMVEAFFSDQEHMLEFVTDKLIDSTGITDVETSIILKVIEILLRMGNGLIRAGAIQPNLAGSSGATSPTCPVQAAVGG